MIKWLRRAELDLDQVEAMSPRTTPGLLLKFRGEKIKTAGRAPGAYMA